MRSNRMGIRNVREVSHDGGGSRNKTGCCDGRGSCRELDAGDFIGYCITELDESSQPRHGKLDVGDSDRTEYGHHRILYGTW